jgi:hypothetical protein
VLLAGCGFKTNRADDMELIFHLFAGEGAGKAVEGAKGWRGKLFGGE